jgi:sRNA-binding regulator protein Hfq
VGIEAALKVFETEIGELKKHVDSLRKKMKAAIPGPASADILNRLIGKKAMFTLRTGQQVIGTLAEHDRYNCLVQAEDGQVILLKHALDVIKPLE